jgi:hypothetical protein
MPPPEMRLPDWNHGLYGFSHQETDTGALIRHLWVNRRRPWEGYRVCVGRTGREDLVLGTYQTLGAAQHAAEAYLTWRAPR